MQNINTSFTLELIFPFSFRSKIISVLEIQLTLSNSTFKGPKFLFEFGKDSNYGESFIRVSCLKGPQKLFELGKDSNYGGSN